MGDGRGDRPFETEVKARYSDAYLADVYQRYCVPDGNQRSQLRYFLVNAGCRYLGDRLPIKSKIVSRELRKELQDLAAHVSGLRQAVENLTPQAQRRIWNFDLRARSEIWPPDRMTSSFGHKADAYENKPGEWIFWFLDREKIEEAVEVLDNYTRAALDALPDLPPGRPGTSEGLRMWVLNAESLWTRVLERRFSCDWNKGQPVTLAAQFCLEMIRQLDPKVLPSLIETAMRKQIAESRKRAKRKNPE